MSTESVIFPSRICLVMAQFGKEALNFRPALPVFIEYYTSRNTQIHLRVMTDHTEAEILTVLDYIPETQKLFSIEVICVKTDSRIYEFERYIEDTHHRRYGWRMNDYWKLFGLIFNAEERFRISIDNDMDIFNKKLDDVLHLTELSTIVGLALPLNPRLIYRYDNLVGQDPDTTEEAERNLMLPAVNMSPIAFDAYNSTANVAIRDMLTKFRSSPCRGPSAIWRAVEHWIPLVLPPQWCVCTENVGIEYPILLHVGHEKVKKYYNR